MTARRRNLSIIALMLALLGGVFALAVTKSPVLGLDLQGGLEVVLEAEAPAGEEVTDEALARSVEVMRNRVDRLGVAEPEIRRQGDRQIVIELPGVRDASRAAEIIGQTARLEFYDLEGALMPRSQDQFGQPRPSTTLLPLLTPAEELEGQAREWYAYGENRNRLAGPEPTREELLEELRALEVDPARADLYVVPESQVVLTCGENAVVCPGVNAAPEETYYYLYRYAPQAEEPSPALTGDALELDGTRQDFDPQTNQPIVLLQFTDQGGDRFQEITQELATRGQLLTNQLNSAEPILQHFAIVLDNEIRSWPSIDFQENPAGIAGDSAQITGLASLEEAEELALVLQTGALPLEFEQVERTEISATLGEDSLKEALIAGAGALVAVALFLLLVYRFLGLVAVLGLAVYGALLYAVVLLFGVTLTLPGFAGLILTIGVAADANIVIFERIREEARGRSVRAAIAQGYKKGFATIVDANVVTLITAFVLFVLATGGVKGFALMLMLGTVLSMFTAVLATRALLGLLAGFRWFDNPAFMGATEQRIPRWQRIDFVGKRRLWFALSGVLIAVGLVSLGVQGLNLGIDFEGGSQVRFSVDTPTAVEEVRDEVAALGLQDAVVQGRGDAVDDQYESFSIRTEALAPEDQERLTDLLETELQAQSVGVQNVSASFSSQILESALIAVAVSLVLLAVYIAVRFQFKFAVPVLVALVHDILITLGVYSLSGRELTAATVAAVLTILGYSIYDTVIIFDRVRENMPRMKSPFAHIANLSLWETIRRSLATTFITLLPVSSLLLFGGETLKDFAFALLVGIASGAYSTIFIATPLLSWIKEREPEFARRRPRSADEGADEAGPERRDEDSELAGAPLVPLVTESLAGQGNPRARGQGKPKSDQAAQQARRQARRQRRRHGRPR